MILGHKWKVRFLKWMEEFSHENGCCLAPPNIRLILEQYAEKKIVEIGAIEPRGNGKQEKF